MIRCKTPPALTLPPSHAASYTRIDPLPVFLSFDPSLLRRPSLPPSSLFHLRLFLLWINSILHNGSWYQRKNVIDFISRIGREIRLTDLLHRSCVRDRIDSEAGMSFCEFSYQVFQAYDWLFLHDKYGCCFQVILVVDWNSR